MDTDPQVSPPPGDVSTNENNAAAIAAQAASYERWSKLPKTRGRQPRDPNAQSVQFQCRNIDDLERQLREYLEAPSTPAEHTTLEFVYPVSAAFMVYAADFRSKEENRAQGKQNGLLYGKLDRCAVSVIDALAQTEEPKDQMRRQKSIAKVCVEACEKADGFRYSFHNNWLSREDEACRFSYFCNDSTLNKGRAANEGAGTSGKRMRKPVYDCQGLIAIKFSHTKQSLEVHYKHVPLHKTYAERAPPPRRDSKRYKLLQVFDPGSLQQNRSRGKQPEEEEMPKRSRRRRLDDAAVRHELGGSIDLANGGGLQPLVRFLDSEAVSADIIPSSPLSNEQRNEDVDSASSQPPAIDEQARGMILQEQIRAVTDTPGIIAGSLQEVNTRSGNSNSPKGTSTQKPRRKVGMPRLRGIVEAASSGVPKSEFEMLKAKLEEAEQRIKKLESEKLQSTQSWPGPGYPFPLPSQYPYTYPPPYPYPPAPYPQPPYDNQALPQDAASGSAHVRGSSSLRPIQPGVAKAAQSFVPYARTRQDVISDHHSQRVQPLTQSASISDRATITNANDIPLVSGTTLSRNDQASSLRTAQDRDGNGNETHGEG